MSSILDRARTLFSELDALPLTEKVNIINALKISLHEHSPFQQEPVDCVVWVPAEEVSPNLYNPNRVAPKEMALLEHSIQSDGFTQPIVSYKEKKTYEVVDGFHRHRVGKESLEIRSRIYGYLPIVVINENRTGQSDRMAATIRHNRARGKHMIESMSEIVIELSRRNWKDDKIARELGMDEDEVLRLKQISGLASVFIDKEFSEAWEPIIGEDD